MKVFFSYLALTLMAFAFVVAFKTTGAKNPCKGMCHSCKPGMDKCSCQTNATGACTCVEPAAH